MILKDYIDALEHILPKRNNNIIDEINDIIISLNQDDYQTQKISDGYHTFDELYEFRKVYNAALFNEWARLTPKSIVVDHSYDVKFTLRYDPDKDRVPMYDVHKSWRHHDGTLCFGGRWFIVCAKLPSGLISNHYKAEDWDLFKIPEEKKALYEFDGHTSQDTLKRLKDL